MQTNPKAKFMFDPYGVCKNCETGKQVEQSPECFINRDNRELKNKHRKTIKERGWTFKEEIELDDIFKTFDSKIRKKRKEKNGTSKKVPRMGSGAGTGAGSSGKHGNTSGNQPDDIKPVRLALRCGKRKDVAVPDGKPRRIRLGRIKQGQNEDVPCVRELEAQDA